MSLFRYLVSALILLSACIITFSQANGVNRADYRISISETHNEITIDGIFDEPVWNTAGKADQFRRVMPTDTGLASAATEVKMTYTESTLYLAITCFDPSSGKRPVESLRRDFSFMKNDNFIVFIDTYNDFTNGFAFGVSPAGAQWDGMQANGGIVNLDWDIKWHSAVKNYDDRWVAEFAIPFRSVRYKGGSSEWGINFSRQDLKLNEKSSWAPMPRQFATATLAFAGTLVWDKPLPSSGTRFSVIPYASLKTTQNKLSGEKFNPGAKDLNAGLDAKVILTTSINLDLTVNPDYSHVEVDRQVTNLDRFELLFPEKRQFYLENSDLFANLGTENLRPFFSRRIGLTTPVIAGARLSGKIGDNWRIGFMDIHTGEEQEIASYNFAVAALQRKVFTHSNITAFIVNRQHFSDDTLAAATNRVVGLEYNLATADNRWTGKAFWHGSYLEGNERLASAMATNILYSTQYLKMSINQSLVGSGYTAETGFIRRTGYYEFSPAVQYRFYPANSKIANHGPGMKFGLLTDPSEKRITDRETQVLYQVEWLDRSILIADFREIYVRLREPFDPTRNNGLPLPVNAGFNWFEAGLSFTSDIRKPFNFLLSGRYGGFFNGMKMTLNSEVFYRIQPYGSLALITTYNHIELPDPYNSARFFLIGPRLDITFTDKLFLTSFVQYNNQIDNLNLNLRFQWRFAPVSDFFIVFTQNSFPGDYDQAAFVKDRGLVLKVSYWFN